MSTANNGGAAFPRNGRVRSDGSHVCSQSGMSLRDWLAGMALQGLLASGHFTKGVDDPEFSLTAAHNIDELPDEETRPQATYVWESKECREEYDDEPVKDARRTYDCIPDALALADAMIAALEQKEASNG